MLHVEQPQRLVPRGELHVPPRGVELRLAPVLSLLQQGPHLDSHAPHQVCSSLVGPHMVGCCKGGQGASGLLAAVGGEECLELHQRYEGRRACRRRSAERQQ